jgi:hypothetical protein
MIPSYPRLSYFILSEAILRSPFHWGSVLSASHRELDLSPFYIDFFVLNLSAYAHPL